jgi:hypothetical protein
MPSLTSSFLELLKDDFTKYKCFIETGTCIGETIEIMQPHFNNLYTIEVHEPLYLMAKENLKNTKINFILGDSSKVFQTLLPEIKEDTIFFLDGHYSSGNTGKGEKDCPLLEELEIISTKFVHNAIIIIDDYRLFGKNNDQDWSDITKESVLNILNQRILTYYHLPSHLDQNDRLIIHLKHL